jgi:hypothetical protein
MNTPEKVLARVSSGDNCKEWGGYRNTQGYGIVSWKGRPKMAHRVIWEIFNGPIPTSLFVLHKCDNPSCANIDHLYIGTKKDNSEDCKNKGRLFPVSGENNPNAKLNWGQVTEIRNAYSSGGCTNHSLAQRYGVGHTTINLIVNNKIWASNAAD